MNQDNYEEFDDMFDFEEEDDEYVEEPEEEYEDEDEDEIDLELSDDFEDYDPYENYDYRHEDVNFKNFAANNQRLGTYTDFAEGSKSKLSIAYERNGKPGKKYYDDSNVQEADRYKFDQFYWLRWCLTSWYSKFPELFTEAVDYKVKMILDYYDSKIGRLNQGKAVEDIVLALILLNQKDGVPRNFYRKKECTVDKHFLEVVQRNLRNTHKPKYISPTDSEINKVLMQDSSCIDEQEPENYPEEDEEAYKQDYLDWVMENIQ